MRQQFLNPLVKLCLGHVRHASVETQVVFRAQPLVEAGVFQQRTRAGTNLRALRSRIEPEHFSASARRFDQAEEQSDGGCLACAVGAKETEHRAGWNVEREVVQGPNRREIPRQSLGANCKFFHTDLKITVRALYQKVKLQIHWGAVFIKPCGKAKLIVN